MDSEVMFVTGLILIAGVAVKHTKFTPSAKGKVIAALVLVLLALALFNALLKQSIGQSRPRPAAPLPNQPAYLAFPQEWVVLPFSQQVHQSLLSLQATQRYHLVSSNELGVYFEQGQTLFGVVQRWGDWCELLYRLQHGRVGLILLAKIQSDDPCGLGPFLNIRSA